MDFFFYLFFFIWGLGGLDVLNYLVGDIFISF